MGTVLEVRHTLPCLLTCCSLCPYLTLLPIRCVLCPCLLQGEVGVVRHLLRANKKLMGLTAADAGLAAAADSSSGATADLRQVADVYGKTPARLAWDTQRWV